MKAQVLYGIKDLRFETDYPEPSLKENEVLVKTFACGICGSDVDRVLKNGTYHFPTIIGHEFSGEVVKSGSEENSPWIGKRVSVFPLIPCKKCASCKAGKYQLCENYSYLGSRCDGGFAEYVSVPVWNLIEIPDGISFEEAAMLEPVSVAIHAIKLCGNLIGRKILITGSGMISSVLVQLAFAGGASGVFVVARNSEKLAWLKDNFPNLVTFNSLSEDCFFDVVIEATGAEKMVSLAVQSVQRRGTIILLGNPSDDVHFEKKCFWQILRKEILIRGTWNSSFGIDNKSDWEDAFSLIKNKKLNLPELISHKLNLRNLMDGILLMKNKIEISNKVMVVFDDK